jgi:hypothetical protein
MVVRQEGESMPRNMGDENESGFEVVIREICSLVSEWIRRPPNS